MRTRVLYGLLIAVFASAVVWLVIEPGPEPLLATLTAVVGLLSLTVPKVDRKLEAAKDEGRIRLAILPLQNIAAVPGREYFAAGLTEELISVLSRVRDLQLIASGSSAQYRAPSTPLQQVAKELHVGAVLHGSVRSVEDELRVSIRLVDASSEALLWSEDYDKKISDVFAVQRHIATSVAEALQVRIGGADASRIEQAPTADLEAYDLYLLARHDLNKRTEDGLKRSIDRFRAALAKDPSFAAALTGLADAHVLATIGYAAIPREVAESEARAAVAQALETQETLADAHTSRGWLLMNLDRDWVGAQAAFERALELNPSDAKAYEWLAQCYSYQGRPEQAIDIARRAMSLDPRSPLITTEAGWPYVYLGRWDEAERLFRRALDLDPDFALALFNLGNVCEVRGDLEDALTHYERAASLSGGAPMFLAFVARAQGLLGREGEACQSLGPVLEAAGNGAPVAIYVAHAYEGLGKTEEAILWLERAVTADEMLTIAIGSTWLPFSRLEGNARYEALLHMIPAGTLARPHAS